MENELCHSVTGNHHTLRCDGKTQAARSSVQVSSAHKVGPYSP